LSLPADPQKAFSVAKIEHPEVMDENGKQKVGGLMDPKMGSMLPLHLIFASSVDTQPSTELSSVKLVRKGWQTARATLDTLSLPSQCSTLAS
jgi:hypothetical protein